MALREINLIPDDILHRQKVLRHLGLWLGCLTVALFLLCGFYLYQAHAFHVQKRVLASVKDMDSRLGATIEEISQLQEALESLRQRQTALETISRNPPYYRIFVHVASILNDSTWLKQLTIGSGEDEEKEEAIILELTGFSFSSDELGNFLNQLTSEPLFKAVLLRYARETSMGQWQPQADAPAKLIQFEVECTISRG